MFNLTFRAASLWISSALFLLIPNLHAQKAGLEVTRCSAIDRVLALKNVAVDASGRKWAANSNGIFQIKAADLATPLKVSAGEKNVLGIKGGNADFSWSEVAFRSAVKEPCSITAAWYDSKNQQLYLGTDEAGLLRFNTQPEFKFDVQWKTVNSKLKSNNITALFQDAQGRLWVGTDKGLMSGKPGVWKSDLPGTNVQRIREYNTVIYVLADGYISKAPGGDKWSDLALDEKFLEGDINDFDIDPTGKMWLLSGNLTRFDMIAGTYDEFGGPEYYTSQYGNCIAVESDGVVWAGTDDKGLFMVDKAYNMVLNAYVDKPISCEGNGNDAVLVAKVTGGLEPYTWTWTGGLSGESPANVGAGTYLVTVSDSKGKARTGEIKVADTRLKVNVMQKKPISAPGMSDGSAAVDLPTNAAGITAIWDNGETKAIALQLSAGEHTVTVADSKKGCTVVLKVTISEVAQPVSASISEKTKIKCYGGNGALSVDIKGGKKEYTVKWSNPTISGLTPENVPAGEYTVTVTDATKATCTASIVTKQPDALVVSALVQAPASTSGSDGKALAQAKGGTGAFFFKWDDGETVYAATKLPAGNRTLTVTDANGCASTATFVIPENVLTLTVNIIEKEKIKCAGDKATLSVEVKGGKGAPKFAWSNPTVVGKDPGNVMAGDYIVTVTDAAGSTQTATFRVKSPQVLSASAIAQGVVSPGGSDGKALCSTSGGSIVGHNFLWDNGEITAATLRLNAGLHYVTVTDDNGCVATASVLMTETVVPLEVTITEKTKINCSGDKATLSVLVSGGKESYKYAWSNPALTGASPTAAAGDYVLTVTDAAGASKTVPVKVVAPAPLSLIVEAQGALSPGKSDGKAQAKPIGGSGDFTFIWDNGETSAIASRLAPGTSKVTVTDKNGCTASASVTMSETFLPLAVNLVEKTPIKCPGEKAALELQVSGGKPKYNYTWNASSVSGDAPNVEAGNYVVTVTDATGATKTASVSVKSPGLLSARIVEGYTNPSPGQSDGKATVKVNGGTPAYTILWSNNETMETATKLSAGNITVTVTDANGCKAVGTVGLEETFSPLAVSISEKTKINCSGEKAALEVQVTGGKASYKYAWSNPALIGASTTASVGDYTLTVTDANGASKTAAFSVKSPAALTLAVEMQAPASTGNSDGKAIAKPSGGAGGYIFQWESGESSNTALRLAPGNPKVTVTDANGCTAVASVAITETILGLEVSITEKNPIKCGGLDKASLQVKISGGKPSYSLVWSNPSIKGENPDGLAAGDYSVTVTDSKGTSKTAKITVVAPEPLSIELLQSIGASAANIPDGKAQIAVKGGSTPYKITWDTKQTGLTAPKLAAGKHTVTVEDAAGCTKSLEVETGRRAMPELTKAIQQGQTIPMRLLTFATDSASLRPAVYTYLDELYDFLVENPTVTIEVGGHTNNQPKDDFADYLSTERAKAVANYLISKGVDATRVQYKGYGKKQPLVPNTSPEGRKTNQRVEIKILTAGK